MQACIEAAKTAPAYKYRTEKRWLNEAQQFLKGRKQEAVGSKAVGTLYFDPSFYIELFQVAHRIGL